MPPSWCCTKKVTRHVDREELAASPLQHLCNQKFFLAENNTALVRQPPYSPDLAPRDFWLFPTLKTTPKRTRFQSRRDIMEKMTAELKSIPEEEFKSASKSGKSARKSVCTCKESILKIK